MAGIRDLLAQALEHADQRLPAGFYVAISVPTAKVRDRLRRMRRPFVDPDAPSPPDIVDVDLTAAWIVHQASLSAATLGGFASVAGAASIPPEALANAVGWVRLAQRLAIVYGFDPETDRGQLAVWRALAAGLDIGLPDQGPLQVRVRDLAPIVMPRSMIVSATAEVARAVIRQSAWNLAKRVSRLVPLISPGISAFAARDRGQLVGSKMQQTLRRLVEVPGELDVYEDAQEIP